MANLFDIFKYVQPRKTIKSDDFNGLQDSIKSSFDGLGEALTVLDPAGHLGVSTPFHVGTPTDNEHAATKLYVDTAASDSTANLLAAEAAQAASELAQAASESAADDTAADVLTTNADALLTAADVATTAANLATIAAIYDDFDDRYLGAKAADPTLDNDGNALVTGALYYNSVAFNLRVYNGASWDIFGSYVHPNHTGDVTSVGAGAQTIVANAVTNSKLANVATATIKGRSTAGTGDPEDLTATQVRTLINVANGANAYVHPHHTGQVTSTSDGATVVTASAITAQSALTSGLAATDELLVSDSGVLKRMDISVFATYLNGLLDAGTLDGLDSTAFLRMDTTGNKSVIGSPYLAEVTLTDAPTVLWDVSEGPEATVTLGGNRTLDLDGIPPAGIYFTIRVVQDATGGRTLAYSADFDFGTTGSPTLSAANKHDVLTFRSSGTKAQFVGVAQGFS